MPVAAFGLMVLVTAVAVLLSIRRDSMFIALLGLVGGFATPALLSTGENRPISLFTYILLLNAGLAWVAIKKKWPLLTTAQLCFYRLLPVGMGDEISHGISAAHCARDIPDLPGSGICGIYAGSAG